MSEGGWLDAVRFDAQGLVTVIAQDAETQRVLMVAWANREALAETASSGQAVYFSRSRNKLWRKGEESGHRQAVRAIRLDCDSDVVLYAVTQAGGIACHTGRESSRTPNSSTANDRPAARPRRHRPRACRPG
jgi:phosphoribosyl-AMP cyclohydrolase